MAKIARKRKLPRASAYGAPDVGSYSIDDGITQSLMMMFLGCRWNAELYLQGWRSPGVKSGLTYGSLWHEVLEFYNKAGCSVERPVLFWRKHTRRWIKKNQRKFATASDKQLVELVAAKGEAIFPAYCRYHKKDSKLNWKAVEGIFDVEWEGFRLRGKLDGSIQRRLLWLYESKTKSQISDETISDALTLDFQNLFYITVLEHITGKNVAGVVYNVIRHPGHKFTSGSLKKYIVKIRNDVEKPKRADHFFHRFEVLYDDEVKARFRYELLAQLGEFRAWLAGDLCTYHQTGSCTKQYTCGMLPACSSDSMAGYTSGGELFEELQ